LNRLQTFWFQSNPDLCEPNDTSARIWLYRLLVMQGSGQCNAANGGSGRLDENQNLGTPNTRAMAVGDVDNDGDLDVFVADGDGHVNTVWLNDGAGNLKDSGQSLGTWDSNDVVLGDIDSDGDPDAVVANGNGHPNNVWFNDGHGVFSGTAQILGHGDSQAVALGDVDDNNTLDVVIVGTDGITMWLNDEDKPGSFIASDQNLGQAGNDVALVDVDRDSDLDILIVDTLSSIIWLNDGEGNFVKHEQTPPIAGGQAATAIHDLDGDGWGDIFIVTGGGQPDTLWLGDGRGNFSQSPIVAERASSVGNAVVSGDLERDGDVDAVVISEGVDTIWLNKIMAGGQGFSRGDQFGLDFGDGQTVSLADIDGDGYLDLLVGGSETVAGSVWRNTVSVMLKSYLPVMVRD
jgi:predicted nucleotidyltransferase